MCSNMGSGNSIPTAIQEKVSKIKEMTKKSSYGDLQGNIKVTRDRNGNYNVSYTQVKNFDVLKSSTIGVGDIPARIETTYTTYVLNKEGKRIDTIRRTETEYQKTERKTLSDWSGANANMGTSRKEKRRVKNAAKWADLQIRRR